ncbi:hypothetical protein [Pseudoalteromonas rubra]|uniref:Uncharacterized protein n=1 Tax=Pseudoalteromonas rubra TaxID=43658 RepID=A0A5S3X5Y1_9GAMM|nr:hypothetical protein [Pseudoalteromonas rubra]TMP39345.1 hypothetical protein CWB98_01790 [Pseudoalteromonas rubra]
MFSILKSLFKVDAKSMGVKLKKNIEEAAGNEKWFSNYFPSQECLYDPDQCNEYRDYTYMLGCQVRNSIIKGFLTEKDYLSKLCSKQEQLIYMDDYGDLVFDDWHRELKRFTKKRDCEIISDLKSKTPQALVDALIKTERWDNYVFEDEFLTDEIWSCIDQIVNDEIYNTENFDD